MGQTIGYSELVGGGGFLHPKTQRQFRKRVYDSTWGEHQALISNILELAKADQVCLYRNPGGTLPTVPMDGDQLMLGWGSWAQAEDNLILFGEMLKQWDITAEVYVGDPEVNIRQINGASSSADIRWFIERHFPFEANARMVWDAVAFKDETSLAWQIYTGGYLSRPAGIEAWPKQFSPWCNAIDVPIYVQSSHMKSILKSTRRDLAALGDIQSPKEADLSRFVIFVEDPVGQETPVAMLKAWWKRGASLRIGFDVNGRYLGATAQEIRG